MSPASVDKSHGPAGLAAAWPCSLVQTRNTGACAQDADGPCVHTTVSKSKPKTNQTTYWDDRPSHDPQTLRLLNLTPGSQQVAWWFRHCTPTRLTTVQPLDPRDQGLTPRRSPEGKGELHGHRPSGGRLTFLLPVCRSSSHTPYGKKNMWLLKEAPTDAGEHRADPREHPQLRAPWHHGGAAPGLAPTWRLHFKGGVPHAGPCTST